MTILLLLALLGSAAALPRTALSVAPTNDELREKYYLPREVKPTFYDVTLFLDPDNEEYFNGTVTIRVIPNSNTQRITLHAMELIIEEISVFADREPETNLFASETMADDDTHFLTITTNTALQADQAYSIFIKYSGQYAANMFGIYVSTYTDDQGNPKKLITSQMQPTFARRAFPCFDEPALKAVFRTTIYAPAAYPVVRSNMPERTDTNKPIIEPWKKYEFQDTLVMSTYLIAYLVSEFSRVDNQGNKIYDIPFGIYSRPGTEPTAAFALEFGQKNMLELEKYTEFTYKFPKLDKVAAPDFAAGAMENWGLVVYREVALLYREGVTTTATKQNIGRIICHENMHMWFGNEVGPHSWTYTWLNEGFANFFENFATDLVHPEWRMMDQYVIAMQNVFHNDAVNTVNPMTHPVFSPSQIMSTFNAVAYQKSGSVIRMMQHFLTPEVFRQGLVLYLRDLSRDVAHPTDLYRNLQAALDASEHSTPFTVQEIMENWTTLGGFPVVTVTRDAPTANSLTVSQTRYFTDPSQPRNPAEIWHVPVNWVFSNDTDFSDTSPQRWLRAHTTAQSFDLDVRGIDWYIFNKQQTGYYRVNYDEANWRALAQVLNATHGTIHLLNRAQLVDDSFNLARNGRLNYQLALDISNYLVKEEDYIPWASANAVFNYLDIVLAPSSVYDLWQRYVLELTAPLYASLGFAPTAGEEHVTPYHRNIILSFNCRFGNDNCVTTAEGILQQFRTGGQRPIPDIQSTVYCSALRGGSQENFDFLWQQFIASTDSGEQSIYLNSLGCTSHNVSRAFYLNQVIAEDSPVREQDRHTIVVATINGSPQNMEAALDFIVENFDKIQTRVQGISGTTNILNSLARRLSTQEHSRKIDELVSRHGSLFTAGEQAAISGIRDNIASSLLWVSNHLPVVQAWLQNYYQVTPPVVAPDSASVVSASFVIFISALVALFNY